MAKETMAEKAKKQKASKVSGLYEGVGKFKGKKSLNLRDKQLGKKGVAASKKRTVSISNTSYDKKTKIVTGPKGNALTGKVDMGGGNMAVYRNGKRVTAKSSKNVKPKATPPKATPPKATSTLTAAQKRAARVAKTTVKARKADTAKRNYPGAAGHPTLKPKPLIKNTSKDSIKPRASYDAQGNLYHESFFLGKWRRVKQNKDGKYYPTI